MYPYMTYSQLKSSAKKQMKPVTGRLIGITVIFLVLRVIVLLASSRPYLRFIKPFIPRYALSLLLTVLFGSLLGMLQIGLHYVTLKVHCNQSFSVSDIFHAFSKQAKSSFLLAAFMAAVTTVPMIPYDILSNWYAASSKAMPFMVRLFTHVPAIALAIILKLIYSQAYFLMLDFPSCPVKQLLKNSRLLMQGHKKRLLFIHLRLYLFFLIGGICTCNIGTFWIAPFTYMVNAKFYLDLITNQNSSAGKD